MDVSFATLDPEATDTFLSLGQKDVLSWRACAALITPGGGSGFVGQEWDTDANAPTQDTDAAAPVKDTDTP